MPGLRDAKQAQTVPSSAFSTASGSMLLRAKIDMKHPNMNMRDPPMPPGAIRTGPNRASTACGRNRGRPFPGKTRGSPAKALCGEGRGLGRPTRQEQVHGKFGRSMLTIFQKNCSGVTSCTAAAASNRHGFEADGLLDKLLTIQIELKGMQTTAG